LVARFSPRSSKARGPKTGSRGYVSSSIIEVAGESIESMAAKIGIICNSRLDPQAVKSARTAAL